MSIKTDSNKKGLAILGSTGNIGQQALNVVSQNPEHFQIKILTANNNASLLIEQAKFFQPKMVFIANQDKIGIVKSALVKEKPRVLENKQELFESFYQEDLHLVLLAIVGFAGLHPCLEAINAGKDIALANKECLVVGGKIIMQKAKEKNVSLIPVDSEHSAIFQCLLGEESQQIEKVILTASGGPFYQFTQEQIKKIGLNDALKHPTWVMGPKVTIDSASLMNKGLEAIEAKWLFNLQPEQIDVVIHPQSIIHSMVQFRDGSIKAQMGTADMRHPIHYAMYFPHRHSSSFSRFNFIDHQELSFRPVDMKKFRNLALAFEAMKIGGNLPAILNAANEAAVDAFLQEKLAFYQISEVVESMMSQINYLSNPSLSDLQNTHHETINKAIELIKRIN
jgi:1-deoxy-D-xylulose-5-phosphate reductoisomerase